jgi:hypothetical protein
MNLDIYVQRIQLPAIHSFARSSIHEEICLTLFTIQNFKLLACLIIQLFYRVLARRKKFGNLIKYCEIQLTLARDIQN